MIGNVFSTEIIPEIPSQINRLQELSNDLYYSWDRFSRSLFHYIDHDLWEACQHNPKVFLRRVPQTRLEEVARDRSFFESYHRALANYDTYLGQSGEGASPLGDDPNRGPVAYFCAEFGFHESLPVYSGGLGILAGDFCKAASDIGLPFVGVGLLYRYGNFVQTIDGDGQQHMLNTEVQNDDLPIAEATGPDGLPLVIVLRLANDEVAAKVWCVKAGHIDLYLLDTDVPQNDEAQRAITDNLYASDPELRLKQEIVLGFGGLAALQKLGIEPSICHINEGHPSLLILARCRELVQRGMSFRAALETVRATTIFTTHTPVAAGHEAYDNGLLKHYLESYIGGLGVPESEIFALGQNGANDAFNLTTFALRCSGFRNGVSRIHRDVAASMEAHVWPDIDVRESPIDYVTNGVHVPTFFTRDWLNALDDAGWRNEIGNPEYWKQRIGAMSDATFWSIRQEMKSRLVEHVKEIVERRSQRLGYSHAQIKQRTASLDLAEDIMLIGFARRFATYKRATLLFEDPDRLRRILNNQERPVVLLYAGRAHRNDGEGQALIRAIHEFSLQPGFLGKVLLLEGYDLALARSLVAGVDLWINAPEYPLEACGTSGMKAAINGVVNLSIADGWWAEGYDGTNGWSVEPHPATGDPARRRKLESDEMLDILENEVIPMYFDKLDGCSRSWVRVAKNSMTSIIPRFNARRMVAEYIEKFYRPALSRAIRLEQNNNEPAAKLSAWRERVRERWAGVELLLEHPAPERLMQGAPLRLSVVANLNGLIPDDVAIECLVGGADDAGAFHHDEVIRLSAVAKEGGRDRFVAEVGTCRAGPIHYKLRAYPFHELLGHPLDMGFMKWL